jgi:hypothetical protein
VGAQNLNQIIVGAAGGQLAGSPETLKRYLMELQFETDFKYVMFYPDAGSIVNPHILAQYYKAWQLLRDWGYKLKILWYGQISKHDFKDFDEYSLAQIHQLRAKLIDEPEFWDMSKSLADAEMERLVKSLGYRSPTAALRAINFNGALTSPLSIWRAVLALQERKASIQIEGQISLALKGGCAESLESELSRWAAVHGGSFSVNGASGLASKKLTHILNKLDSFQSSVI